jgi:hypothetical protein
LKVEGRSFDKIVNLKGVKDKRQLMHARMQKNKLIYSMSIKTHCDEVSSSDKIRLSDGIVELNKIMENK